MNCLNTETKRLSLTKRMMVKKNLLNLSGLFSFTVTQQANLSPSFRKGLMHLSYCTLLTWLSFYEFPHMDTRISTSPHHLSLTGGHRGNKTVNILQKVGVC